MDAQPHRGPITVPMVADDHPLHLIDVAQIDHHWRLIATYTEGSWHYIGGPWALHTRRLYEAALADGTIISVTALTPDGRKLYTKLATQSRLG